MSRGGTTDADLFQLALHHHQAGNLEQAAAIYRQVILIEPGHVGSYINLGNIFKQQGNADEAAAYYRQALVLDPGQPHALYNLANILKDQGHFDQASDCYRKALAGSPDQPDVLLNLGICLMHLGRLAEADASFERALQVRPGHWLTEWNRVVLRLLGGDLQGGWPGLEVRWKQPGIVKRSLNEPTWDGSPLEGKTILIYAERGLGDTLQFMRYLPLVQERGGRVLFECQPALTKLLANIRGADELVPAGAPLPPFEVQAALFNLPAAFGTTLETIPAAVPYLMADPTRVGLWKQELKSIPGFKVGICWQGSLTGKGDERSIPLTHFEALARVPGVRLISLQVGPGAEQLVVGRISNPSSSSQARDGRIENPSYFLDFGESLDKEGAFLDTAALMMNLDLVVTIDTASAHLAGALGVPAWVLLSMASDWRWLLDRADSPWYPTLRLFRRGQFGSWEEMFGHIAEQIAHHANGPAVKCQ